MPTQCNEIVELVFTAEAEYADPYNELEMDAVFTAPGGDLLRVPCFWAGGKTWRVRFTARKGGTYTYRTACSNRDDAGLDNRTGEMQIEAYTGTNPLKVHGRLCVGRGKGHFQHEDGTPFFWVGDTWWMGLTKRLDWPHGVRMLAADRVEKGFNVVQIVAGPLPDMDASDPRGASEAGLPFERDFARVNTAFHDLADLKIAHLVESGLMPCIVGMWGYYLPQLGVERAKRFWRYLVARYGAYPVAWCICGEGTMPYYLSETRDDDEALQKRGWTEVMEYVGKIDAFHNLITIHPTQRGREQVDRPELMDFEMLQTGHGDMESVESTARIVTDAVAERPRVPVVDSEVNYEGILGRCWQNVQRLCFYHAVLRGAAGHTYGANGIWQMSTENKPYGPSPHGRCWGNTSWQQAIRLPGSGQIGLGGAFMRRFPWWEMEVHPEWLPEAENANHAYAPVAAGIPRKLRVIYVPLLWDPPVVKYIELGASYTAYYWDPCTGEQTDLGRVAPDANGDWTPPLPPEVHDWLLVLTDETAIQGSAMDMAAADAEEDADTESAERRVG